TYCTTHDDLTAATSSLALSSVLVVDCEGRNIGMPNGGPSILTLSDISASHIFLIDVLALTSTVHPSLTALHRLFSDPSITKVFWDGRADVLELIEAYPGLSIAGVLDLQLVEVASRRPSMRETDAMRLYDFGRPGGYFNSLQQDIQADPAKFDGIHRLGGLAHVVRTLGISNAAGAKDPAVVAMHRAQGSEIWMRRPLSKALLDYAAHDAVLIAAVYTCLMQEPWNKGPGKVESFRAQSGRYVTMFPDRKMLAKHHDMDLKRFLPMGLL
ncbi:ribonuclease H-like domain-containing protein, partial [Cubamyces menziesii]